MIQFGIRAVPAAHSYVAEGRLRTLGSLPLALLLQVQGGALPDSSATSIVSLVTRSSLISKLVLAALALLSIISWGIIFYKLWTFRRTERQSVQFLDVFRRSRPALSRSTSTASR